MTHTSATTTSASVPTPQPKRRRFRWCTRGALIRLGILFALLGAIALWFSVGMFYMPGHTHQGPLPPLTPTQTSIREQLRRDVEHLATTIGERSLNVPGNLTRAGEYLEAQFRAAGYSPTRQPYRESTSHLDCFNIEAVLPGTTKPGEIIVIGGHYDSVEGTFGANDNATGAAGVLALARALAGRKPARTIRFVEFVNEEPPYFKTDDMGSVVYAKACRQRGDNVVGMLCLETIGYYSDAPHSQQYPPPFSHLYPSTGNFIGFIGNYSSRALVKQRIGTFRATTPFPSEGAAVIEYRPELGFSDHWSFWQQGYPALMVTDTAMFRYRYYHTPGDKPDKIDFDRTARVVGGLVKVVENLAAVEPYTTAGG
jgi:hypothetical protein